MDAGSKKMDDRRDLRVGYAKLASDMNDSAVKTSLASNRDVDKLQALIRRSDDLLRKVTMPKEQALDSSCFATLASSALANTRSLAASLQGQAPSDFMTALRLLHVHSSNPNNDGMSDPEAFQWAELVSASALLIKDAPGVGCMRGPLLTMQKLRKVSVRQVKTALAAVVRPEEVSGAATSETEAQATDRNMEVMWNLVKKRKEVPMAELVCNHRSFAQTIENLFTLAFLVRDNRVKMTRDEELGYVLSSILPSKDKPKDASATQMQYIMTFHMDDWACMTQLVSPADELMPHREQQEADERVFSDAAAASKAAASAARQAQRQSQAHHRQSTQQQTTASASQQDMQQQHPTQATQQPSTQGGAGEAAGVGMEERREPGPSTKAGRRAAQQRASQAAAAAATAAAASRGTPTQEGSGNENDSGGGGYGGRGNGRSQAGPSDQEAGSGGEDGNRGERAPQERGLGGKGKGKGGGPVVKREGVKKSGVLDSNTGLMNGTVVKMEPRSRR